MDHYETLGVNKNASAKEIKKAYRKGSASSHPDKKGGSTEKQQQLTVAYNVLSDPEKRARYDRGEDVKQGASQERWVTYINTLFNTLIDEGFEGDIIKEAKARNVNAVTANQQQISSNKQRLKAIKASLGRIVVTDGNDNFFENLQRQKITLIEDAITCLQEQYDDCTRVGEELEKYTDSKPPSKPTRFMTEYSRVNTHIPWSISGGIHDSYDEDEDEDENDYDEIQD